MPPRGKRAWIALANLRIQSRAQKKRKLDCEPASAAAPCTPLAGALASPLLGRTPGLVPSDLGDKENIVRFY